MNRMITEGGAGQFAQPNLVPQPNMQMQMQQPPQSYEELLQQIYGYQPPMPQPNPYAGYQPQMPIQQGGQQQQQFVIPALKL